MTNKPSIMCFSSSGLIILTCTVLAFFTASCDRTERAPKQNRQGNAVKGPIIDIYQGGGAMDKLAIDKQGPESLALLGDQYFESGKYLQAIDAYRKVIELAPNDADTYNDLGLALFYTGQPDEAIDILSKGTQVDPNYQNTWLSMGFILSRTTRNDEAKLALQKAVEINPNSPMGKEATRMLQDQLN